VIRTGHIIDCILLNHLLIGPSLAPKRGYSLPKNLSKGPAFPDGLCGHLL
jgi:hypothetical protein